MPIARINNKLFFFVHVPKCAGTSIKSFLKENGVIALDGHGRNNWSKCTADHIHEDIYGPLIPQKFYDHGFIVFRDPVTRLQSEFKMFARAPHRSRNPVNWILSAWARLRGRKIYSYQFMYRLWHVDPDTWARAALWISRIMPYRGNNHYRPQAAFWREDLVPFRLEDGVENVIYWISTHAELDIPKQSPHINPSKQPIVAENVNFSEKTKKFIRKFYAVDYTLLDKLEAEGRFSEGRKHT